VFFRCAKLREQNLMVKNVARRLSRIVAKIVLPNAPSRNSRKNNGLPLTLLKRVIEADQASNLSPNWLERST
jgi:hypothetical protein